MASSAGFAGVGRIVNGGINGLPEMRMFHSRALAALSVVESRVEPGVLSDTDHLNAASLAKAKVAG